jgi:hypothetical protein
MTTTPPTAKQLETLHAEILTLRFTIKNFRQYEKHLQEQGKTWESINRDLFLLQAYVKIHTFGKN